MAANKAGTNLFTPNGDTGCETALTGSKDLAMLARVDTTAHIPSGVAGYQIGCILINLTTGSLLINQGTTTSCSFRDVTY